MDAAFISLHNLFFCSLSEVCLCWGFFFSCFCFFRAELGNIFCLSWIITWFGHVLNDIKSILRIYDFFIACHALMPIYLTAAVSKSLLTMVQIYCGFKTNWQHFIAVFYWRSNLTDSTDLNLRPNRVIKLFAFWNILPASFNLASH